MSKKTNPPRHPAKFPKPIVRAASDALAEYVVDPDLPRRLLDPFVGAGGVSEIEGDWEFYGCEIEPEWASQAAAKGIITQVVDSRKLPFTDGYFGAIFTSPTYGNRLADSYFPDMTKEEHENRRSYKMFLGRALSAGNTGAIYWGEEYRHAHLQVWSECKRVLCDGGLFILNIKDHPRKKVLQGVPEWHIGVLSELGFDLIETKKIPLRGDQNTNTMRARGVKVVDHEMVYVFRKPHRLAC